MPPRMRQQAPVSSKRFARSFKPYFEAGDTKGMGRMIAAHPGLIGKLMNHGPGRRVEGVEAVQTPDGETRYAFKIRNARTGTTGPEQPGGSIDPKHNVISYSHEEIGRGLQSILPADKVDKPQNSKGSGRAELLGYARRAILARYPRHGGAAEEKREAAHPPEG